MPLDGSVDVEGVAVRGRKPCLGIGFRQAVEPIEWACRALKSW
jgi:hypothetical protein